MHSEQLQNLEKRLASGKLAVTVKQEQMDSITRNLKESTANWNHRFQVQEKQMTKLLEQLRTNPITGVNRISERNGVSLVVNQDTSHTSYNANTNSSGEIISSLISINPPDEHTYVDAATAPNRGESAASGRRSGNIAGNQSQLGFESRSDVDIASNNESPISSSHSSRNRGQGSENTPLDAVPSDEGVYAVYDSSPLRSETNAMAGALYANIPANNRN